MTTLNRYGKAAEIERVLISRMEERFRDGNVSEDIAEFFLQQNNVQEIPLLLSGKKRKLRTLTAEQAATAAPPGVSDTRTIDSPPLTNRGVTFHGLPACDENTGPAPDAGPLRMGGYDGGVKLGFEGTWQRKDIFETLETAKELAAKSDSSHACFEINGVMYVMQASSAREGNVYKYVFEGDGVKYYVHSNPKKNIQPVRIRYNAEGLIGRDLFLKHYDTLQTLENMGFRVTGEKLTRVDMQVMLPISMEELFYMGRGSRVTISCSAQNEDYRYKCGVLQTFTMGNIDTQEVCCYDKRAELFHAMKREPVKFALMLQECLGPDFVTSETPLTRVEFGISCPLRTKSPSDYLFPRFVERLRKHRW